MKNYFLVFNDKIFKQILILIFRLVNAVAKRHLNMQIDSYQYIKPAIAYFQELMNLANEKGFIMSRINARELSNKLSDSINNGFIGPLLKV